MAESKEQHAKDQGLWDTSKIKNQTSKTKDAGQNQWWEKGLVVFVLLVYIFDVCFLIFPNAQPVTRNAKLCKKGEEWPKLFPFLWVMW